MGKCDHEQSCGYHYTPKEYFRDNPEAVSDDDCRTGRIFRHSVPHTRPAPVEPSYIPEKIVRASLSHYDRNPLYRYLCSVFGAEETARLFNRYRIGTSAKWGGSTVFWQTDESGKVRTGKIMLYNPTTGRRVKEPQARVSWAHAELRLPDSGVIPKILAGRVVVAAGTCVIRRRRQTKKNRRKCRPDKFFIGMKNFPLKDSNSHRLSHTTAPVNLIQFTRQIDEIPSRANDYISLKIGDRLISLTGNCGRLCVVCEENLLLNQRVGLLYCDATYLEYFYNFLNSNAMRIVVDNLANGAAQANLSPVELCKIGCYIPQKNILCKYNKKADAIRKAIVQNQQEISLLTKQRNELLPLLMNGQVSLNSD